MESDQLESHLGNSRHSLKQAFRALYSRKKTGVSLFETVIALGLMGMVLIPMFLFSYSNFATILTKGRDRLAVGHEVSMALYRMQSELAMARQISSSSTTTAVYFTYYDAIQDAVVKRGYQLSANGSGKKLERLSYSNGSWTAFSPYPNSTAASYMLPSGTVFSYCAASNCALSSNNQALSVKLASWSFYRTAAGTAGYTLTLPTLEFYLSSGNLPELYVNNTVKQLYSISKTTAFSSSADLKMTYMTPDGNKLSNVLVTTSSPPATTGLTTLSTVGYPDGGWSGYNALVDASNNRYYFNGGDRWNGPFTSSWAPSTGLSTLYNGGLPVGLYATTPRLFMDTGAGQLLTWASATGVSTIISNVGNWMGHEDLLPGTSLKISSATGRIFFRASDGSSSTGPNFYTWSSASGLSTILQTPKASNSLGLYPAATDRVYFGDGGTFYSWSGGALTTIISGSSYPGMNGPAVDTSTGRVVFGMDAAAVGKMYTWLPATGLSTIASMAVANSTYAVGGSAIADSTNSRFYFDAINDTGATYYYSWSSATGLSTIINSGSTYPFGQRNTLKNMYKAGLDASANRIYFGGDNTYTWSPTTGLSTIHANGANPETIAVAVNGTAHSVYFSTGAGGVYRWASGTGLSTLYFQSLSDVQYIGVDTSVDRVYFSSNYTNNYRAYTWRSTTGLSTILTNPTSEPFPYIAAVDSTNAKVLIGESGVYSGNVHVYAWSSGEAGGGGGGSTTTSLLNADFLGSPTGQTKVIDNTTVSTYVSACQDIYGDIFLIDSSSKKADRYHYHAGLNKFQLGTQLNWTSWATTVGACATDQSNNVIALLDTGNKQIDVYTNRYTNGTPSAPTSLSLASMTSPTGMTLNGRTGDYLVLDSALQSSTYVRLFVVNSSGTITSTINIDVTTANLSVDATTETNFKIAFNENHNVLYLIAPNIGYIYALALDQYL